MKAEDLEPTTIYNYQVTLERVRDVKAGMGLGDTSVDMSLARLKYALNRAVTRGLVTVNVASEVHIPLKTRKAERKTKAVVQPWNASEVGAFVAAVKGDRLYAPLLLSLMGLRPAEVCGLRWSDIDLNAGTLNIANTRTMMGNRTVVEEDTKSMAGERVLSLPSLVREALKTFRATQAVERLAAGEGYEGTGYVLVNELGAALNGRQLRVRAYKIMDENGLRRVRLYDARASCLTYLAANGVPDHLLVMWAGHTNVKTTKKRYVKPDVADLLPAAEAWGVSQGACDRS
ncbi:tyrosine-type recombinase/integrase [Streptomyces sp. NPDC052701]|uniref:site-specific integrase n=1 Tax=Streptomyces sp. NPDC052701 TaxID=3155533 RepID=UPI0034313E7A